MTLQVHSNYLCLPLHTELLVSNYETRNKSWIDTHVIKCNETPASCDSSVQCCSFSPCGKYIAICFSKDLIIYGTTDWKQLCSVKTERKGVSVRFFSKSSTVLLAEKSGNVKFYKISGNKIEKTELIVGHNSMLIDALITEDDRFIITCDRDEKIRITHYPNIYNIQCYCLGHTKFVSSIVFLESDKNVIISASGDGTIRLWEIVSGQELVKYDRNINEIELKQDNSCFFNKIISYKTEQDSSFIAASEYQSECVSVLKVNGCIKNGFAIDLLHVIKHSSPPLDIALWETNIIVLLPDEKDPLKIYDSSNGSLKKNEDFKDFAKSLLSNWDMLIKTYKEKSEASHLLVQYTKDVMDSDNIDSKKIRCK